MSYLRYANPFHHLGRIIRGYLAAAPLWPSPIEGEGRY